MNPATEIWELVFDFEQSNYYHFYNTLLNDNELIKMACELGYKIQFMPHPVFSPHIHRFNKNPDITFLDAKKSYRELYSESALILTDYSSAVFDFAYLGKPIIYAQFDREELSKKGTTYSLDVSFYDNNAFGEICFDYESTREALIDYMKNDCKLKPEYKKRIDEFFAYRDKSNCERIVKKLKNINLLK